MSVQGSPSVCQRHHTIYHVKAPSLERIIKSLNSQKGYKQRELKNTKYTNNHGALLGRYGGFSLLKQAVREAVSFMKCT